IDDHQVGLLGRAGRCAEGAQLLLKRQRIGLVDPAAEGDHGILHGVRAFLPISVRYCMPSNEICRTPSYARPIASPKLAPRPTTVSTRPPAVTSCPWSSPVPAWKTETPSIRSAFATPWMGRPDSNDSGYPRDASTTPTALSADR